MKGRTPVPDVIKIANCTLRKCRQRKSAKNNHKVPRSPFPSRSIAGRKWKEICTGLHRLGLIDEIDATHIEAYCRNYQLARDADVIVEAQGIVLVTEKGVCKNPACTVSADAWNKVRAIGNDLGLNHLSRQRMASNQQEAQDKLEEKYLG